MGGPCAPWFSTILRRTGAIFFRSISSYLELQNDMKTSRKKDCPPNKSLRILFTNPDSMTFYHFFNTFFVKKVIILVLNNTIFEISSQNWVYSWVNPWRPNHFFGKSFFFDFLLSQNAGSS
jgi:hypothetical protein